VLCFQKLQTATQQMLHLLGFQQKLKESTSSDIRHLNTSAETRPSQSNHPTSRRVGQPMLAHSPHSVLAVWYLAIPARGAVSPSVLVDCVARAALADRVGPPHILGAAATELNWKGQNIISNTCQLCAQVCMLTHQWLLTAASVSCVRKKADTMAPASIQVVLSTSK